MYLSQARWDYGAFGGGICFLSEPRYESEKRSLPENEVEFEPVVYSNTIESNTAQYGAGIYVGEGYVILNSEGKDWKHFNSPAAEISFVENTDINNNTYFNNNAADEGKDIKYYGTEKTASGNLSIIPETASGNEGEDVLIKISYEFSGFSNEGSITIRLPSEITVDLSASVTITDTDKRSIKADEIVANNIVISAITGENMCLDVELVHKSGLKAGDYIFKVKADADGAGTYYVVSDELSKGINVPPQFSEPEISLKSPVSGTESESNTLKFTWEATPGSQSNMSILREVSGIEKFIFYIGKPGEEFDSYEYLPSVKATSLTLEYASEYEWKVKAIQYNGKESITSTNTVRVKYRLKDLGIEGETYSVVDNGELCDDYSVELDILKLPVKFRDKGNYKITVGNKVYIFEKNDFMENLYRVDGIPYFSENTRQEDIEEIKKSIFESFIMK